MPELSPEDLTKLAGAIAERIVSRLPAKQEMWLFDAYTLADAIGLSVPTIHRVVAAGSIPSIRAGGLRLYCIFDVLDAVREAGSELTQPKPKTDQAQRVKPRRA